MKDLSIKRVRQILQRIQNARILVIGDLMLDQFVWGAVRRISPEAPVPVVEFERESFMPGGAANVARNLTALQVPTELFGIVGHDDTAHKLKQLLIEQASSAKESSVIAAVRRAPKAESSRITSRWSAWIAKRRIRFPRKRFAAFLMRSSTAFTRRTPSSSVTMAKGS